MDLELLRDYIQTYELYIQLSAFIAYVARFRTADTFVYMCVGILILMPLHFVYEKELLALAQQEEYRPLVRNLWYFGFGMTDILLVWTVAGIARKEKLKFDIASIIIAGCFILLAIIQLIGYVDHVITETHYFADFYMASIPIINVFVTSLIAVSSAAAIAASYAFKKEK